MMRVLSIAMTVTVLASPAMGQSRMATSSITVERPLSVISVRPMSFSATAMSANVPASSATGEAIIQITGDPGRIYRVRLPAMIEADTAGSSIDSFTIRSDNAGDISTTLTARMDDAGQDRLHVGGLLRRVGGLMVTDVRAAIPLSIDYE